MSKLRTLLLSALCASTAVSQAPSGPASRYVGYRTFFETHLLDRSPRVARVRFLKEDEIVGVQAVVYEVKSVLRGPEQRRVLVGGDGGLSVQSRSVDRLIFFEPLSSGLIHRLIDVVELIGPDAEETVATVRRCLALSAEPPGPKRRSAIRALVLDSLASKGEFTRKLGAREFVRAIGGLPGAFDATDLPRLKAATARLPSDERTGFLEAIGTLEAERLQGYQGVEAAIPAGRERELFLLAVEALREAPTAAERAGVVEEVVKRYGDRARAFLLAALTDERIDVRLVAWNLLGLCGHTEAAPAALKALVGAEPERSAAAECLGMLGLAEAVPSLAERLDLKDAFADTLLTALARIGSPPAKRVLEAAGLRAETEPAFQGRRAKLAELRDPAWREKDAAQKAAALRRIRPER